MTFAATAGQQAKRKPSVAWVMMFYLSVFAIPAFWLGVWLWDGHKRCVTGWDARFVPMFEGQQCSIMQHGLRVPVGEYWSPDEILSPEKPEPARW